VRALITGVAGFIGSTLGEKLVSLGHDVVGVDCFTDYYARQRKEKNLTALRDEAQFSFVEADVVSTDLAKLLDGIDVVFHQAAQAGVRASWGTTFESYVHHNVLGTQLLLEAVKKAKHVKRVVYASSSSIYGDTDDLPMREHSLPKPYSPYGVTKLAAENLCELYRNNFGVSTVSLRYFTVYGPRQRPDMAFNKFIRNLLAGEALSIFGSGKQTRDFTYIDDIVDANIAAAIEPKASGIYNIGGGSRVTLMDVLTTLADVMGVKLSVENLPEQAGDVKHTEADTTRARAELGYAPKIGLREGLTREVDWLKRDG
jgi:nucleoside-diphosphate-sugar epimerase